MRLTLTFMAVLSAISMAVLGNFYQVTAPKIGNSVIAPKTSKQLGGSGLAFAIPNGITDHQYDLLNSAYRIARDNGLKHPEILQGIVFQETHAGALDSYRVAGQEFGLKTNERYYGICQIKLKAARDVLKAHPELLEKYDFHTNTDEEVIANLILNDDFNLEIASLYLKIIADNYGNGKEFMIAAFNKGPGGAKNVDVGSLDYVKKVKQYIAKFSKAK